MAALRKYGQSRLGPVMGIAESEQLQQEQSAVKNSAQDTRRLQRVSRMGYRQALRNKDYKGAMGFLQGAIGATGETGSGIGMAGGLERQIQGQYQDRKSRFGLYGNPSATPDLSGQTTELPGQGASINDQFSYRQLDQPTSSLADAGPLAQSRMMGTQSFYSDLNKSDLIKSGDVGALGRATERAGSLGISRGDLIGYLNRNMFGQNEVQSNGIPDAPLAPQSNIGQNPNNRPLNSALGGSQPISQGYGIQNFGGLLDSLGSTRPRGPLGNYNVSI